MESTQGWKWAGAPTGAGAVCGSVLVVGAGVSGCACGATLAAAGVDVTVVGSALDAVGFPCYGPVVCEGPDSLARMIGVLEQLPDALRSVWIEACAVPETDATCVVVDRRMLSVETKRALEGFKGLKFRQGLVVDVRVMEGSDCGGDGRGGRDGGCRGARAEVETAFGEVWTTDLLVLAPGLSLGGRVAVGQQEMVGGRYGETPSDGLRDALTRLGAEWTEMAEIVGPRYAADWGSAEGGCGDDRLWPEEEVRAVPLQEWLAGRQTGGCDASQRGEDVAGTAGAWRADLPPSPYFSADLGTRGFAGQHASAGGAVGGGWRWCPDGLATGEVYLWPGLTKEEEPWSRGVETRSAHVVKSWCVSNVGADGRAVGGAEWNDVVWLTGRATGARDYVESLESGVAVARALLVHLGEASSRVALEEPKPGDEGAAR